jgi:hypothetical protein
VMTTAVENLLVVLGVGFLIANLRILAGLVRYRFLRGWAVLTWPGRRPPAYRVFLVLALALLLIIITKVVVQQRGVMSAFGELMMFGYYGVLVPASLRVRRGFYEHGLWMEGGYIPYTRIGGLAWREEADIVLVVVPRRRASVRRLVVSRDDYAEARRILRDKIAEHEIHYSGETLDLGGHDERRDI